MNDFLTQTSTIIILCCIILSSFSTGSLWDEKFVRDFFNAKLCSMGTLFYCGIEKGAAIRMAKNLMAPGVNFRISMFEVSQRKFKTENALQRGHHNLAIVLDIDCSDIQDFLDECYEFKSFYDTYRWLIFGSNRTQVFDKVRRIGINMNAETTVAVPNIEKSNTVVNWTLYDVYNSGYNNSGEYRFTEIGYFNHEQGYYTRPRISKYYERRNLTGTVFRSGMVVPENITMTIDEYIDWDGDPFNNTFSRYHSAAVENCHAFYNFTSERYMINSWGYEQPTGGVDGMIGEFHEKRLDFGNAALMLRVYRLLLADFGVGCWIVRSAFVFRHPKTTSTSSETYLRPLSETVWFTILLTVVFFVVVLKVIMVLQHKTVVVEAENTEDYSWSFLVLYGIGELCQQGYAYIPSFISGKLVTMTVLVFSFIIYQFYSASIVSFLLSEPPKTIKTLSDLLRSNLKAGCENSLFDIDWFKKTTDPVAISLYKKKMQKGGNHSSFFLPEDGLEMVTKGEFAFHAQVSTAYPIIEKNFPERVICELAEVQMYPIQYVYMITQKHSPYRELFSYCLQNQWEVGVVKKLRNYWQAAKPVCLDATNYLEISVGLDESYWGLMILGIGMLLGIVFLGLEIFWAKKRGFIKNTIIKRGRKKFSKNRH